MIKQLRTAADEFKKCGACEQWLDDCDPKIKGVCKTINGQLLEALLTATGYKDIECVDMLRKGIVA